MQTENEPTVTVLGSQWVYPIADLARSWISRNEIAKEEPRITPSDTGSMISIALLLMVMLESYTVRAIIDGNIVDKSSFNRETFSVKQWWKDSDFQDKARVSDALSLRDAIAHNHVYWLDNREDAQEIRLENRLVGGNSRFFNKIDNGKFKSSGLSGLPNSIHPNDILILSDVVRNALNYLRTKCTRIGMVDFGFVRSSSNKNMWELLNHAANMALVNCELKV